MQATPRIDFATMAPQTYRILIQAKHMLAESTLGKELIDLVYLRISQINGCAFCVDLHARDLLSLGEPFHRINNLITWREVDFYTERERAALAWAEVLTHITQFHGGDAEFAQLSAYFTEKEVAELTLVVGLMNGLNRLGISSHMPVIVPEE
ncbi:carboxymuconolactone decarboxylase family protein [Chitinivorax sp. B]|uniref:carboxymuconolactone decarboxylase family protein n=1 Tax=Chitinivorax sp. B TaxID=2502235 RepID=UPI0010F8ECB9|nr:carboxymuconolactone decarboxylase family protein [Chitinivorax sp. B]